MNSLQHVVLSSRHDHIPQMKRRTQRRSLVFKAAPPAMEDECASMIRGPAIRNRQQGILAYAAILATCTAGILHFSWWAFLAGACVLALISISNHAIAGRGLGATEGAVGLLLLSSLLNATVTSAAALTIGRGIAWVWGV
jgi:hypothetical protein